MTDMSPGNSLQPGPLAGVKVIEFGGDAAVPLCAMQMADWGAQVIRIEHEAGAPRIPEPPCSPEYDIVLRGRPTLRIDLATPAGAALALDLLTDADALIEGFDPGTMESFGLGPEACLARNPRLVYARMTGWGQSGPFAGQAGCDINHVALTGALHALGRRGEPPTIALSGIADYAGSSMYLGMGVVAALIETRASGRGQVVDAARVDGVALLMTTYVSLYQAGMVSLERGANLLDTGSPFYDSYACADGLFIAFGGIEPRFYAELLQALDLHDPELRDQGAGNWPRIRAALNQTFATRTRAEWTELLGHTDACFAPILDLEEAFEHPQVRARGSYVKVQGVYQPGPNPHFSHTQLAPPAAPTAASAQEALADWLSAAQIASLVREGVIA